MPTVGIAFCQTDLYSALCVKSGVVQMGRVIAHCVSTSAFAFVLHTTPWSLFTPTYPHTLILSVHSSQDPGHDRGSGLQLLSCGSVADSGVLPSWSWKPTRGDKHVCVVVDKMLGAFQLWMMFLFLLPPPLNSALWLVNLLNYFQELCPNPQFIVGGATRTDIRQGGLGE